MHDGRTRKVESIEPEPLEPFLTLHRASITILRGPAAGTEYVLDRKRVILGRSAEVGIRIDDPSISSEHIAFELSPDGYGVRDLASTNGVQLNGANILAADLKHGDRLTLGECELQYVVEDRSPEARSWSVDEDA